MFFLLELNGVCLMGAD